MLCDRDKNKADKKFNVVFMLQSNLSIADTCGSWEKCPLLQGVRYILGLEIPMDYIFYGDARVVLWLEKAFKKITENIDAKVAKCLE